MKKKLRKNTFFGILLFLLVLLSGCESVRDMADSVIADIKDTVAPIARSTQENNQTAKTRVSTEASNPNAVKTQQTAKISSRNYKAPASYDEAYSWRTGRADQKMMQLKNNKNVDALRKSSVFDYIERVVQEINATAKNDFEKAKMAHDITALVVKYDAANFWKGTIPQQDFISVLTSGTAVCEGYANTYKKFCDELKLPCQVVHGYARGVGTTLLDEKDVTDSNHAWNIVQINNAWYLVDCTWDSGFMQGRSAKQEYTTDWLFTRPEHFIYTHLPTGQNYQLMSSPFSAAQFSALPELRPSFFDAVTDLKTDLQKVVTCDGKLNLAFDLQDGYTVSFAVQNIASGKQISNGNFTKTDGTKSTAMFSFPSVGKYSVQIFYWKGGAKTGKYCGEFIADSTGTSSTRYPTTFANYGKDLTIASPTEMPLKSGATQKFYVTSNKKFVYVIAGNSRVTLSGDGKGNFTGEVSVPKGTRQVSLAVADSERGSTSIVATYTVE